MTSADGHDGRHEQASEKGNAEAAPPVTIDARGIRSDDLRYLLAVARSGRRRSAAKDLGVDHTTVSRRVNALEKALGVRLLQRSADGWELTDVGRSVAEKARLIEEAVQETADVVAGISENTLRGTIRVTAPDGFGPMFVAPALAKLRMNHPNLVVELITATRQLNLQPAGFDIAVAVGTPISSRLVSERICQYSLGLYASEQYLRDQGEPATMDELTAHPLIFFVDSLLQVGDLDLERHLPGVTAKFMSTNIFAHVSATRAGGGIGLLPAFMADQHPDLRRVMADLVDVRLSFSIAARRASLTNPAVQAVRRVLQEEILSRRDELLPEPRHPKPAGPDTSQ
ncbi:LysR family transcriptional regulator [Rhodococcus oxybenzonivorans]|uniref:LysR family transcriptional regulator n=1 Tax=Rhodococcus oxybenzonivorans TaxID=1990687 RepID=A0A2S2BP44_9NOCA|nr:MULTISPECIES: LysR family transcriptional regulator [Rhodococcus]AWK70359.1 LysR family transcriptional regulator [Rhodococcus oxybenzonivorans]QTJ66754.1 LysR family transcriptional regulator [Rhodococcus sp. ZPP]